MSLFQSGRQIFNRILNPPADIKHHGLVNQGETSYLNSVLQVLFMTKDFREAVERYICENPGSEYIDRQLKDLFDDLKERNTYTYKITKKLGIDRVYEQQDAAEYFEKILALTSSEASQIFHGQLTHKTVCSECLAERNTDGPFWHLPLELVDPGSKHYSVVDGTKEYFTASHFSGENQMYCEHCDAKSDATIRCVVKHHPEVLMLLLKRFEFDYRYMMYAKNNCVVDVPYTLQIPENQTYELYAVVDHYGALRGGHYTATVKSQDGKTWYNFNDTRVTLLSQQLFQTDNTEKSQSVYLLFYRKKKIQAADTCAQDTREELTSGGFLLATNDNNDQCQDGEQIREREEDEEMVEVGTRGEEYNHYFHWGEPNHIFKDCMKPRLMGKWGAFKREEPGVPVHESHYQSEPKRETPERETHVNQAKHKQQPVSLVSPLGKKCLVNCMLDSVAVEALWDSGAQATIINETWRAEHLPHTILRSLQELLGPDACSFTLTAANQTEISLIGWVEVNFKLYNREKETEALTVPILVSSDPGVAKRPIIGFNVIEKCKDTKPWIEN
ncbi:ubiquitin carboxyl-terminal hydrolase 12-like isoform X2 [Trachinotus anak]|uniref:ubiquitin carboxyl-terminal hydrolase 12-like isoform X2 n=1 Tax=Trachinotus anak TaxID=443729 RepID=UPI0039F2532A